MALQGYVCVPVYACSSAHVRSNGIDALYLRDLVNDTTTEMKTASHVARRDTR